MVRFRLPLLVAAGLSIALSSTAYAQSTVEAEKLFRDGKALMKQGKLAEACDAFDASQRIESNVATLMSLADCREKNQQYASAWGWFLKAESMTRNEQGKGALNATARKRAAAIEPRMSYLTVNVPDESRIDGLIVSRNGVMVDPGTYNRAVPVDGGEYEIEGKAPGHEQWTTKITVKTEGDKQAVEVPKFKELPKLIEQRPITGPGGGIVVTGPAEQPFQFTTKRKIAAGIAGGAVASLAAGIVLGVKSKNLQGDAEDACSKTACSNEQAAKATHLSERSRKWAIGADVAFGVSAAAAIGAGVLFYLGGPSAEIPAEAEADEEALHVRPHVGEFTGFTLDGSF